MFKAERQDEILRILKEKQHTTVELLAQELFASPATVRRDIQTLEKEGLVHKTYGGVSLVDSSRQRAEPFELRQQDNTGVKTVLARRAAAMVHDGDTIILDSSSTVLEMVPFLAAMENLTIITNSLKVTERLHRRHLRVYCTGGQCTDDAITLGGSIAETTLRGFNADLLFFSSRGISPRGMICDSSDINSQTRRVMLRQAARPVMLCDSSKLNRSYLFNLCHVSEVDTVLCDQPLPESWYY